MASAYNGLNNTNTIAVRPYVTIQQQTIDEQWDWSRDVDEINKSCSRGEGAGEEREEAQEGKGRGEGLWNLIQ